MTRLLSTIAGLLLFPIGALAQSAPAPPPPPAAPALPSEAPPPPAAPVVPPEVLVVPLPADRDHLEFLQRELDEVGLHLADGLRLAAGQNRLAADQARVAAEQVREAVALQKAEVEEAVEHVREMALHQDLLPFLPFSSDGRPYTSALNALQRRQYDRAITLFDRVIAEDDTHRDAATYWKAFSLARLVRIDDAIATIAVLRREHPQSRYLNDAKMLEADIREMAGQQLDPETLDANDELKLIAINGIANTDPDTAIPLLERVLGATNTLGNKRRALFVLALNEDPRAGQLLLRYARGSGNPELQVEAIRLLVSRRGAQTGGAELGQIYASAPDLAVRRAVIDAYRRQDNAQALVALARREANLGLKRDIVSALSTMAARNPVAADYLAEVIR